jgi:multicomponent Na+:H+ antiporter subunit D
MAFGVALAGWLNRRYCLPIAAMSLLIALIAAVRLVIEVMTDGVVTYQMAGWPEPIGIAYTVDALNAIVLVVVSAVALVNLIGTSQIVMRNYADRLGPFYTLYVLHVTGLLGIVITADAFNLFVLLEITSISGYALIGMGRTHASLASLNYIFMGTIGASFYLLGVGYLYLITGSLNMADIAAILPSFYTSKVVLAAFVICMTGLLIKMALFPLHGWLSNAYFFAPSVVSGLIAPLTTKVMIYVMIRISLNVFTAPYVFEKVSVSHAIVWLAILAIVIGSFLALSQRSLKRMLTYIVIAEVGYMVGGFWLANRIAITGAILHIVKDAAMTLCVFLAACSLRFKQTSDWFENLKGVFRKQPVTMAALVVGALSIIGVPPTCGFFSKWYLISGGIAAGHYAFVAALLFSSLVNAVLFFRVFEVGYFEPFSGPGHGPPAEQISEAPLSMLASLLVVSAGLIMLGIYSEDIVTKIIESAIPIEMS